LKGEKDEKKITFMKKLSKNYKIGDKRTKKIKSLFELVMEAKKVNDLKTEE
jgi:hypothetical protein